MRPPCADRAGRAQAVGPDALRTSGRMTKSVEQLQAEYDFWRSAVLRFAPVDPQRAEEARRRLGRVARQLDQAVRLRAGKPDYRT